MLKVPLSDLKLVFRNPSLRIFLGLPILVLLFVFLFVPYLIQQFPLLNGYEDIILMAALMQCSTMFGFIYCMVFIDEKEEELSKVYGVMPLNHAYFVLSRLAFPVLYASVFNFCLLYFQPFLKIGLFENMLISILSALICPIVVLLISSISKNKVQGLTIFKIVNLFINLPILAFFFPNWKALLYMFPSYWPFQAVYDQKISETYVLTFLWGFALSFIIISLLLRLFVRRHYQEIA